MATTSWLSATRKRSWLPRIVRSKLSTAKTAGNTNHQGTKNSKRHDHQAIGFERFLRRDGLLKHFQTFGKLISLEGFSEPSCCVFLIGGFNVLLD